MFWVSDNVEEKNHVTQYILVQILNLKGKVKNPINFKIGKKVTQKKESDSFELYFGNTANEKIME